MKNITIKITLSILLFSLLSCATKINFIEQELKWFNIYEKGDTLEFKNIKTKKTDTSVVIRKESFHDWQLFANSKYRTSIAVVQYSNETLPTVDGKNQHYMFSLSKTKPTSILNYSVSYLNSDFLFKEDIPLQSESLFLTQKSFTSVYKLSYNEKNPFGRKKNDNNPEFLYWDVDYGIIKYITFSGEVWERINW